VGRIARLNLFLQRNGYRKSISTRREKKHTPSRVENGEVCKQGELVTKKTCNGKEKGPYHVRKLPGRTDGSRRELTRVGSVGGHESGREGTKSSTCPATASYKACRKNVRASTPWPGGKQGVWNRRWRESDDGQKKVWARSRGKFEKGVEAVARRN